uniref:U3 small nucleolar RNA-associated protein 15 homolog n=1 Tax=Syphacia muris TaxID=451379 RepID=A0A0N5AIG5_9BILA
MAQPYKPLHRIINPKIQTKLKEDQLAVFQEPGNMTSVAFSTSEADYVASTSSIRLSVFDVSVCEPVTVCSRFKEAIYCVTYRKDGKLLAVGGQDGRVRIFDAFKSGTIGNKAPLRTYKSHSCPVHAVLFTASGKNLIAMGDDGSIKVYDIMEVKATPIKVINGAHSDHIRCGDASKTTDYLFASGSYDHTAKVWNLVAENDDPLVSVDHGCPLESILFVPGDSLLITAGGQFVKFWAVTVGGKLLQTLHNHHKTVTSLCLASDGTKLLTGGLDKKINVYRLNTGDFSLAHTFSLPAPVYALSVSINDNYMVVGMGNLLGVFRREAAGALETTLSEAKSLGYGLEYQRRKKEEAVTDMKQQQRGEALQNVKITAPQPLKVHGGRINDLLRQFKHWKAVDVLFRNPHFVASNPDVIVSAFREIYDRQALCAALAGRDVDTLRPLLLFLCKYLFRPRYFDVLFVVTQTFLVRNVYADEQLDIKVTRALRKLLDAVGREISLQKNLHQVCGQLEVLFTASRRHHITSHSRDEVFGDVTVSPLPFVSTFCDVLSI